MKGMHNNAAAMGLLESMTAKNEHRIREIYNMGYNQGYRDGTESAVEKIVAYAADQEDDDNVD